MELTDERPICDVRSSRTASGRRAGAPSSRASQKRVALFTGAYNHIADGVSLTLNRLVEHLERQGAAVRVFAPTVEEPPVDHAGTLVPVRSVPAPGRPEYRVALGLSRSARRELEAFRPNLFHVATPDLLGRSARKLARRWGVPLVASYHTHFSSYLKYYGLGLLEGALWAYLRRFYRPCQHVYVPSPSMAEVLRHRGITGGLRLWQRGVDTTRFSPDRRSLEWRRAQGIGDDEVVVTFVSRLVREKGLDVFAEVVQGLRARGLPHRCLVVGDGPARDEIAARLPGATFTGYLEGDALARAYASADVFVFPSDTETFGNVTLEAMASGLPTVCADATGSSTLVDEERTGLLAPSGNTGAFLDATARLVMRTRMRRRMGRAARQRAERYDWQAILSRVAGYYDEILNPRRAYASAEHAGDGAPQGEPTLAPVS
jgi:glycosyltransferase involved in cell wall biosynthesis